RLLHRRRRAAGDRGGRPRRARRRRPREGGRRRREDPRAEAGVTRVKVCGITNLEDARQAGHAAADALGFIFVENTPRFVTPEQVAPIVRKLPPFVTPVGVFWDHPSGHVKSVVEACGLRAIQLHGDEKPEDWQGAPVPVVKTIKLSPATMIEGLPEYKLGERIGALKERNVAAGHTPQHDTPR